MPLDCGVRTTVKHGTGHAIHGELDFPDLDDWQFYFLFVPLIGEVTEKLYRWRNLKAPNGRPARLTRWRATRFEFQPPPLGAGAEAS